MTNPREDALAALERLNDGAMQDAALPPDERRRLMGVVRSALQAQQPDGDDWVASNDARNIIVGQGMPFAHVKGWCDSSKYAADNDLRPVRLSTLREAEPTPDGERERLLESIHVIDADRSDGAEVGLKIGGIYLMGPFRERRKQAEKDAEKIRAALLREAQQPAARPGDAR